MSEVQQNTVEKQTPPAADKQPKVRATKSRQVDSGPQTLPTMEHFVQLVRKVQCPELIRLFIENVSSNPAPISSAVINGEPGTLPLASRNAVFAEVGAMPVATQSNIERAAERICLLCDEYGALAIGELMMDEDFLAPSLLKMPADKFSKALHLFVQQEYPQGTQNQPRRFDHAEARQEMLQRSQTEKQSSHYLGPKGVIPNLDAALETALKQRLSELLVNVKPQEMLVEQFVQRDLTQADLPITHYTLSVKFNGARINWVRLDGTDVLESELPAFQNLKFSWQSNKGTLSVYFDDVPIRPQLAAIFRDIVLDGNGSIEAMPMREFDLMGFCTPAMLARFKKDRIEGIDDITIQHLVVTKPEMKMVQIKGKAVKRLVENSLVIRCHRWEDRDIYTRASEVDGIDDLTDYVITQVKLRMVVSKSAHRRAHNVSAQITAPNGFNDSGKTKADTELVFAQLMSLGCARQY
jgi:hypothetical protein